MTSRYAALFPPGTDPLADEPIVLHDAASMPLWAVQREFRGFDAPPFVVTTKRAPGVPGGYVVQVTPDIRTLTVPVWVHAESEAQMRSMRDDLVSTLDPQLGDSVLVQGNQIGQPSGDVRRISVRYADGLQGDGTQQAPTWWRFSLTLLCLDPFWYSLEPVTASWLPRPGQPFFPFGFPMLLAPAGLVPDKPLEVGGKTKSWPTWTMTAPFLRMRMINDRSGEWVEASRGADDASTSVVLTTKPGRVQLRTVDGVNVYRQLIGRPFPLLLGDTVSVEVDGQGAATRLDLAMDEAWMTAP